MLLSDLHESDDLPLLARVMLGRIAAGDKIRVKVHQPSEREDWWGPLQNVRLGTPFKMNPANPIEVPRLFIHWRQGGEYGHSKSEWVRADTFDDRFELVKDASPMADWVLKYRGRPVDESLVPSEEPLLVTLIDQRLQAGDKVIINIEGQLPQFDGTVIKYKHVGLLSGIAELVMKSPAQKKLANGDRGVSITFEKQGASKEQGYKGWTEIVLPREDFDDLYTLKKTKSFGQDAWMMVNT